MGRLLYAFAHIAHVHGATRALLVVTATLAILAGIGSCAAAAPSSAQISTRDQIQAPAPEIAEPSAAAFERFLSGWPGHYDNRKQHADQITAGLPEAQRNPILELHVVSIDVPAFGPRAFYAEWLSSGAAATPMRQRIYAFERDAASGMVVLRLHIFPTDATFVARTAGAWRDPARLSGLAPADMAPLRGCDVWFRAVGGASADEAFAGEMQKGRCRFPSFEDPAKEIYSWSQMTKTNRVYSYQDGWFNLDGSVYRRFAPNWYVFEKR